MNKENFKNISSVPERLQGEKAIVLEWLLEAAYKVSIWERPKGKSIYSFYFDEGVFKGGIEFTLKQEDLTALNGYIVLAKLIGWVGHKKKLKVLESYALEIMKLELKEASIKE